MKKWYTVVVAGHSEKLGLISASVSGEAESVEEAQFVAEGNCVQAVRDNLGEVVDFRIVAVFEGELTNLIEPDDGYVMKRVEDEDIRKIKEVLGNG